MAVTHDDVRHVADLARLAVNEDAIDHLVSELNGILAHMDELSNVVTTEAASDAMALTDGTPVRSDAGSPLPMLSPIGSFAAEMRDGFFIVPRLASHGDGEGLAQ